MHGLNNGMLNVGSSTAADVLIETYPPLAFQVRQDSNKCLLLDLSGEGILFKGKSEASLKIEVGESFSFQSIEWKIIDPKKVSLKKDTSLARPVFLAKWVEGLRDVFKSKSSEESVLKILEIACDVMEADHGILKALGREEYYPRERFKISRTAIEQAVDSKETLVWNKVDDDFSEGSQSIQTNQLSSILVFPFSEKKWFYLQRKASDKPFGDEDKKLFESFGRFFNDLLVNFEKIQEQTEEIARLKDVRNLEGLLYQSSVMETLVNESNKAAGAPVPVLIRGETGTGKEVLAKYIHKNSTRNEGPFVTINCGAIPANLIESVLFGHKKGSFTGANEDRKGVFEQGHLGTVFLDEIGELDLSLQVRLLRVLQEKKNNTSWL